MADKSKGVRLLPWLATLLLLGAAASNFFGGRSAQSDASQGTVSQLLVLSRTIPQQADAALSGDGAAFDSLQQARSRLAELRGELKSQRAGGVRLPNGEAALQQLVEAVDVLIDSREPVLTLRSTSQSFLDAAFGAQSGDLAAALGADERAAAQAALQQFDDAARTAVGRPRPAPDSSICTALRLEPHDPAAVECSRIRRCRCGWCWRVCWCC